MINLDFFDRAQCTREEKTGAVLIALELLALSEQARRKGILSIEFEELIETCSKPFLRTLIRMVVDVVDPEVIQSIGETRIKMSGASGSELLESMISLEGILSLQKGDNPYILYLLLSAFLGNDADLLEYSDPLHLQDSSTEIPDSAAPQKEDGVDLQSIERNIQNGFPLNENQIAHLGSNQWTGNPFQDMQSDLLAIVMMYMDDKSSTATMKSLTQPKQSEVIKEIFRLSDFDAASFIELARTSLQNMVNTLQKNYKPSGGPAAAANLLKSLSRGSIYGIMESLRETEPALAEQLRNGLFTFDDMTLLDDRSIQKVIREVDNNDLIWALTGASPAVTTKFFNNMSARAARMLRRDMDYWRVTKIAAIKEAQQKIITIVRHLEDCGKLIIERPDDE